MRDNNIQQGVPASPCSSWVCLTIQVTTNIGSLKLKKERSDMDGGAEIRSKAACANAVTSLIPRINQDASDIVAGEIRPEHMGV